MTYLCNFSVSWHFLPIIRIKMFILFPSLYLLLNVGPRLSKKKDLGVSLCIKLLMAGISILVCVLLPNITLHICRVTSCAPDIVTSFLNKGRQGKPLNLPRANPQNIELSVPIFIKTTLETQLPKTTIADLIFEVNRNQ